ncbi:ATP synthase F1 subunit epsilon [Candidatus Microgenomates bacterium]|nr:ATP synthase F1 subunit epsilon [Candidatus Microgenomates bacterium]
MLSLSIVTPEKIAFEGEIKQVTVPGADGQLTILSKHASLFAQLIEGELQIMVSNKPIYMAIGGGFVEVHKDKMVLMVTRAIKEDELNEKEILKAKARAEEILKDKLDPQEYQQTHALLRAHLVDLRVLKHSRNRRSAKTQNI